MLYLTSHRPLTGVFITKGDVGVGTIVGSAVFNILVIIGLSGIFAGQVQELHDMKRYSIRVNCLCCCFSSDSDPDMVAPV